MILLIVIQVINIFANQISEQVFYLYPTEGEFYQNYIRSFITNAQLMCQMYPQVPNVQVINQCKEIYRTKGNEFISMSSNNTHFGTLSNDNEIVIYEWKNQTIQQLWQTVTINPLFNCFNIDLSFEFSIIIDCYYNNEFFLIKLIDAQSTIAYQIYSYAPISTKIKSIINGTNTFLVYAQYFENYAILSLFSSQFLNLSSLINQFVDFDIPNMISPNIYAITFQEILQISISSDSQFYLKYNFSQDNMIDFTIIDVYYNFQSYSQCDQIQLLYIQLSNYQSDFMIGQLMGCEGKIIKVSDSCPFKPCQPIQNILQNNQFIIYQSINEFCIYSKQAADKFYFFQINQRNSLLYFDYDNYLFQFDQEIGVYQISVPSIQINLTKLTTSGNLYNFSLTCMNYDKTFSLSLINFYIQILNNQDTNIYVTSNYGFNDYEFSVEVSGKFLFYGYSGQLLNYKLSKNEPYFNVTQITFYKVGETNQVYQFKQFLSINYPIQDEKQYLIGYINQQLDIISCIYNYSNQFYQLIELNTTNISVNANSLKVSYSLYPNVIIIGLSTQDTIFLFQYLIDSNSIINYSNQTFKQKFSDFLVTYNSIIILMRKKQEILITTFNFTNSFSLNQKSINKLFKNIQFNPEQIIVNTQLMSSLLFINNINDVIILSIDQNNFPKPISLIKVNFTIKQINLVNQYLILSYLCNNEQNICFQVWNVQNLPQYYYIKNLYSVKFDSNITIQSDNLFFYVTFSNLTFLCLQSLITISYEFILYVIINIVILMEGIIYEKSIIISNKNLYKLFGLQNFNLTYQFENQVFNNSISYPKLTYNYTITSALNDTAIYQTPNQTVTFYANFTIFSYQNNLQIDLTNNTIIPQSKNVSYPMNLILDRQVGYCNISQTQGINQYCSLTQFFHNYSKIPNYSNYSLITSINNEFFAFQNNSYIQIVNSDLSNIYNLSYSNLNLSECLKSTSSNYTLYSICQDSTSQYLLNFTLNSYGYITRVETTQLPRMFLNISKISSVFNQIFVSGSLDQQQYQQLYWLNQSNNAFQPIFNSNYSCQDFSISQIVTTSPFIIQQQQQIIMFYIHQKERIQQLYYLFLSVENNQITLQNSAFVKEYISNNENSRSQQPPSFVLIMQTFQNRAIILLTNFDINYISEIIDFRLQQSLFQTVPLRTIPNYGNLNNTGYSFYKYGVLMQQFLFNQETIVGVYYLNNLFDENLIEPILMQGLFITSISNYAMIVDQKYQNGTSLYIYNQSIYNYSISTWNVTCLLNRKTQNQINISIFCSNDFSNGTYNILFYPPQVEKSSKRWIYALISIISVLLLYFYIKVKYKTRNLGYIKSEIEL